MECTFCEQAVQAIYSCPRCDSPYCSLSCYKSDKHAHCRDAFTAANLQQSMQQERLHPEREHMKRLSALLRSYELSIEEDECLLKIDDVDSLIYKHRVEFMHYLPTAMQEYHPWFLGASFNDSHAPTDIPSINSICSTMPSPLVWTNAFEVVWWIALLERKDLGGDLNEIELIDSSVVLSGMVSVFDEIKDLWMAIDAACQDMLLGEVRQVLMECCMNDLTRLITDWPHRTHWLLWKTYNSLPNKKESFARRLYFLAVFLANMPSESIQNNFNKILKGFKM